MVQARHKPAHTSLHFLEHIRTIFYTSYTLTPLKCRVLTAGTGEPHFGDIISTLFCSVPPDISLRSSFSHGKKNAITTPLAEDTTARCFQRHAVFKPLGSLTEKDPRCSTSCDTHLETLVLGLQRLYAHSFHPRFAGRCDVHVVIVANVQSLSESANAAMCTFFWSNGHHDSHQHVTVDAFGWGISAPIYFAEIAREILVSDTIGGEIPCLGKSRSFGIIKCASLRLSLIHNKAQEYTKKIRQCK